jgi:hypothetical protein
VPQFDEHCRPFYPVGFNVSVGRGCDSQLGCGLTQRLSSALGAVCLTLFAAAAAPLSRTQAFELTMLAASE